MNCKKWKYVKEGEERQADFFNIVGYSKLADFIEKYLKQGVQICVLGWLQTRNYEDKDGKRVYVTEVVADRVQFLDSRNSGNTISNSTGDDNVSPADFQTDKSIQGAKETNVSDDVFADFGSSIEISDDDIAF